MKLIESKAEYIPQEEGLEGIYKQIELAGRTAYHSQDKITPDSAKDFVDRMIKSKHGAALEAGTVYLMVHTIAPEDWNKKIGRHALLTIDNCRDDLRTNPTYDKNGEENWWAKEASHKAEVMAVKYADNPYSKVKIVLTKHELNTKGGIILTPTGGMPIIGRGAGKVISVFNTILITTNLRVLQENNWLDDLQYLCSPTEFHEKRYTMRFTCDRGVSHELVRHRTFSFLQESTRYCNYSKDKFDNELTFIIPRTPSAVPGRYTHDEEVLSDNLNVPYCKGSAGWLFYKTLLQIEKTYQALTSAPPVGEVQPIFTPQQARQVLPNALKTELIMTGFASDWARLFELRLYESTGKVAPDMKVLMQKAWKEFENYGITRDLERYIKL